MSKWHEISQATEIINTEANNLYDRKLKKDASVIVGDSWSDFLLDTSANFEDMKNHSYVDIDQNTNSFACLVGESGAYHNASQIGKPLTKVFTENLEKKAKEVIKNTRNPYARKALQLQINSYRSQIAQNVSSFDAKAVMDKRHNMAIETSEKLTKATQKNPEFFSQNRDAALIAIDSLDIEPIHKAKLSKKIKEDIAEAAATTILYNTPNKILESEEDQEWKKDLNFQTLSKLERQASQMLIQKDLARQSKFLNLSKIHFKNKLARGKGIEGVENELENLPEEMVKDFLVKNKIHEEAYNILEEVKKNPISSSLDVGKSIFPSKEDPNYLEKLHLYEVVTSTIEEQNKMAKKDPALFVEKLFLEEINETSSLEKRIHQRLTLQNRKGIPSYNQKMLTNNEREAFIDSLNSKDSKKISSDLKSILEIEFNYENFGYKIIEEVLDGQNLPALTHFYIESQVYKKEGLIRDIERAMATSQSIAEMSNRDEKKITELIEEKLASWQGSILSGNSENAPEVTTMKAGLLELSRFYQFDKKMSVKSATDMAFNKLFKTQYTSYYGSWEHGEFYIPKNLIDNKQIIELDQNNINYGLIRLKSNIIKQKIGYDKTASFGKEYWNNEFVESREIKSALRDGTFRLTKNKKSVYYVYFDENGEHPLMESSDRMATWGLLDLNKKSITGFLDNLNIELLNV